MNHAEDACQWGLGTREWRGYLGTGLIRRRCRLRRGGIQDLLAGLADAIAPVSMVKWAAKAGRPWASWASNWHPLLAEPSGLSRTVGWSRSLMPPEVVICPRHGLGRGMVPDWGWRRHWARGRSVWPPQRCGGGRRCLLLTAGHPRLGWWSHCQ